MPQPPKPAQQAPTSIAPTGIRPGGPMPGGPGQQQQQQQQQQQPQAPTKQNRVTTLPKPVGIDPLIILQERENRWVFESVILLRGIRLLVVSVVTVD